MTGISIDDRFRVMSYPDLLDFKAATAAVRDVAGIADSRMAVRVGGQAVGYQDKSSPATLRFSAHGLAQGGCS